MVTCFLLTPTDRVILRLRRYKSGSGSCEGAFSYHTAWVPYNVVPATFTDDGALAAVPEHLAPPKDDPRWPRTCSACAYEFLPDDPWQLFQELIYVRTDTGAEVTLREAPVGAMWDAHWLPWKGPDGKSLVLMTPGGEWTIDGPSSSDGHWTRRGEAPRISVSPSINFPGKFHGWLIDGVLMAC